MLAVCYMYLDLISHDGETSPFLCPGSIWGIHHSCDRYILNLNINVLNKSN